jgi:predicted anti-sigma-YlaC factor YlaD
MAMNSLADALSGQGEGGSVYLSDNDPVLVGEALPFSLKLMETILLETPEHEGLLVATATGFVSYSEMWVLRPSRYLERTDFYSARSERMRAKSLFLRAKDYAGQALDLKYPGVTSRLAHYPDSVVLEFAAEDLPAVYWYTAALGRAISTDLGDADLLVQGRVVRALLERALDLDPDWNQGALHELVMGLPTQLGGSPERTEEAFAIAMELNGGKSLGPMVSLAEAVHVHRQDREAFTRILTEVLAFDVDRYPENRLTNILSQQHAQWLLDRADELFWADPRGADHHSFIDVSRTPWPSHH